MTPARTPLSAYVLARIDAQIEDVIRESARTEHDTSEDGIHDLRVAIRRLSESLRVFERLFAPGAASSVRRDLRKAMKQAGEARNRDIARGLLQRAEIFDDPELASAIVLKRDSAARKLAQVLHLWNHGDAFRAWREQLRA